MIVPAVTSHGGREINRPGIGRDKLTVAETARVPSEPKVNVVPAALVASMTTFPAPPAGVSAPTVSWLPPAEALPL